MRRTLMSETKHSPLPWDEQVTMLSINPDAATTEDVARMAAENDLMRAELIHIRNKAMFNGNHAQVNRIDAILEKEALDD